MKNLQTDVLSYYAAVSRCLKKFLKGRMLASKIWMPNGMYLIKRGSKLEPLYIEDLTEAVTPEFLELRANHLSEVKTRLTKTQIRVWNYFVPRRLCDFFYATNNALLDRIFFDIDRGKNMSKEDARIVAMHLIDQIKTDFQNSKPFVMWTGSSFHIYLFPGRQPASFYSQFQYNNSKPHASFTGRWAEAIRKETGIKVRGGHDKDAHWINIDPSQTPSGKLARAPFSLHMKDANTVDGVAIPLAEQELKRIRIKELEAYTPEKALKNIAALAKKLP